MDSPRKRRHVPTLLDMVPLDILSNKILGEFCTGKTISKFAIIVEGYYHNNNTDNDGNRNCTKWIEANNNNQSSILENSSIANNTTETTKTIKHQSSGGCAAIIGHAISARCVHILKLIRTRRMKYSSSSSTKVPTESTDDDADGNKEDYVPCEVEKVLDSIQLSIQSKLQSSTGSPTSAMITRTEVDDSTTALLNRTKERIKWISEFCAIIDYFELIPIDETRTTTIVDGVKYCTSSLIVYVSNMMTTYNGIDNAIITFTTTSPDDSSLYATDTQLKEPYSTWSISVLRYWLEYFEQYHNDFLAVPYQRPIDIKRLVPYGTLSTTFPKQAMLDRVVKNRRSDEAEHFIFVPKELVYARLPPVYFVCCWPTERSHPDCHTKLKLYWDPLEALTNTNNLTGDSFWEVNLTALDWEDNMKALPSHVIEIMNRLNHMNPDPYQHVLRNYETCNDHMDDVNPNYDDIEDIMNEIIAARNNDDIPFEDDGDDFDADFIADNGNGNHNGVLRPRIMGNIFRVEDSDDDDDDDNDFDQDRDSDDDDDNDFIQQNANEQ